jgi:hypothetical protein
MKKSLLFFCGFFIVYFLHAQQLKFSVEGGINFSGAYAVDDGVVIKGGPLAGYQIGVSAKKIINQKFSFQPSLLYVHGGTYRTGVDVDHTKYFVSLLRLPLDIIYQKSDKFFFGAGPFIGYAMSGKHTFRGKTSKIYFGNNPDLDDSKRLDAGLDFMAGYVIKPNLALKGCFDLGLINPALSPLKVKSRVFGIMINYLLKK